VLASAEEALGDERQAVLTLLEARHQSFLKRLRGHLRSDKLNLADVTGELDVEVKLGTPGGEAEEAVKGLSYSEPTASTAVQDEMLPSLKRPAASRETKELSGCTFQCPPAASRRTSKR
jgi:hypothetical protein